MHPKHVAWDHEFAMQSASFVLNTLTLAEKSLGQSYGTQFHIQPYGPIPYIIEVHFDTFAYQLRIGKFPLNPRHCGPVTPGFTNWRTRYAL